MQVIERVYSFSNRVDVSEYVHLRLYFSQDCTQAVTDFVEENMKIIAGIGIGIGLVEVRTVLKLPD